MRTLLLDNHDSFTHNLFQLLGEVNGMEPLLVRNDEASWAELEELEFDNIVISPGPGSAARGRDFGVCADAISCSDRPLLGVCLGHQGLGLAWGGRVGEAPEPVHGRSCKVIHAGAPLFAGMPRGFEAVRYHSLCVAPELPADLEAIAWTPDGMVMGLAHRTRPQWGVQFHPESIGTEYGARLVSNFAQLTRAKSGRAQTAHPQRPPLAARRSASDTRPAAPELILHTEVLEIEIDPERAFSDLYDEARHAFWLDGTCRDERSRFSFLGDASGPLGKLVDYDVEAGEVRVVETRSGRTELLRESIFDYLGRESRRLRLSAPELPFDFNCGFVGYLGYELKADCGAAAAHASTLPDAAMLLVDRLIAVDHQCRRTYLIALAEPGGRGEAQSWLALTRSRLEDLEGAVEGAADAASADVRFRLGRPRSRHLEDVVECKRELAAGETYEICLTNKLWAEVDLDPLAAFRELRRRNPAPYAAFLRFGERAVLSSSPERFLRVERDGWVEARPIKGTAPRAADLELDRRLAETLAASEKDRAESLMVTDLLRNDLGSVCEVGTVEVPRPMEVESYQTVHQLVATIRGRLRSGLESPDCIRACFPPGSMTGVPKQRTMEIIDRLEGEARGVYSGALGYLGLGGGADLSVVIRTIVLDGSRAEIGVGGAVLALSDPDGEYEEALLKGEAPVAALGGSLADA